MRRPTKGTRMSFGYKVFYHADLEPLSETDLIIEGIFGQA